MKKPIINLDEVELHPRPQAFVATGDAAERFDAKMGMVSEVTGAKLLGYNITSVPPGKRAFPFHNHRVNEEMFLILEGTGEVRIGKERHPIKQHDIITCPPGGEETAHQIINTGDSDLKYLAVSTKLSPEIANYPDSGKFGVLANLPENGEGRPQRFMYVSREENGLDYWDGE